MSFALGNLSLDVFNRFFRQRSFLEKAFFLVTLIWILIAFVGLNVFLRSLSLTLLIGNLFLLAIERTILFQREKIFWQKNIFFPIAFRTFLFYIPVLLHINSKVLDLKFLIFDIPLPFWQLERDILALILLIATLARSIDPRLLIRFRDPVNFLLRAFRGIWLTSLALLIIASAGYFADIHPSSIFYFFIQRPMLEYLVLGGLCANIISGLAPLGRWEKLARQDVWNRMRGTLFERVRDSFIESFLIVFVLILLRWIGISTVVFGAEFTSAEVWVTVTIILLIGGLLLFLPNRKLRQKIPPDSLIGGLDPAVQKNVSRLGGIIQNLRAENAREVFLLPEDRNIIKQGETNFRANKGTLAVPIPTDDPNDATAIIFVGKGELKTRNKVREIDGPTTVILTKEEWRELKEKFIPQNWQELIRTTLPSLIERAIIEIKKWEGPENLFTQLSRMATGESLNGKYFIKDSREGTRISLPGFRMFEDRNVTMVRILNLFQMVEARGIGEYVRLPFLQIIDTKKYSVVSTPIFAILDAKECEVVNILGYNITEGDTRNLAALIEEIKADALRFEGLINTMLQRILLDPEMHFISTRALDGKPLHLLTSGEDTYVDEESSTKAIKKRLEPADVQTDKIRKKLGPFKLEVDKIGRSKPEPIDRPKYTSLEKERGFKIKTEEDQPEVSFIKRSKPIITPVPSSVSTDKVIDIESAPICPLCGDPITDKSTICPYCQKEFHREHFLHWIRSKGFCPECGKKFRSDNKGTDEEKEKSFGDSFFI
ncbi:MAG: hypothetical protein ACFFC7_05485 [Candidatus Hermodarchaeota archaeon]